ncbi:MAG: hypothetical protein KAS62_07795, partial [Candidatus Delongbacteria bacterium]|nr:hypothetical protein [Candidatus Delongbacteria bacterium]
PSNVAPTCTITSPVNNATYTIGDTILVQVDADDEDGTISEVVFYLDSLEIGVYTDSPYSHLLVTNTLSLGLHTILVEAEDNDGAETESQISITINEIPNNPPVIDSLIANPASVEINGISTIACFASDTDGDSLSYSWEKSRGVISGIGSSITWTAPNTVGEDTITCTVSDGKSIDLVRKIISVYETNSVSIISPNGGEILQMGDFVYIYFDDNLAENVSLSLYKAGEFDQIIDSSISASDSAAWTIPTNLDVDTDYTIKIESTIDPSIFDFSDNDFTIASTGDYIIVISSNGGDIWLKGSSHVITWYDNIAATVSIELWKNNAFNSVLYTGEASDGSKNWVIPNDFTIDASADYSIRVVSDAAPVNDFGDNFFCIAEPDFTGNILGDWDVVISKQPVVFNFAADGTWTDPIYSGTWEMVGNGIRWDVVLPAVDSDAYGLGIVEGNEMIGTVVDPGGNPGDWYAERVIPEVLTPNGGQVWMHGTTQTITWDLNIAGNVVLSLADDTGIVQEIATVLGSDGTYDWIIPASIDPGAAYLIRVAREINGEAYDQSDNYICIS